MSRVLVIEDDRRIAELLRAYLARDDHEVTVAFDGREGLRRFGEALPDLVILDLMLPGVHGRDVCRAIRTRSAVPILMLTALDDDRDVIAGLDLGADDYVTKPFKPAVLMARVRALLRRGDPSAGSDEIMVGNVTIRRSERLVLAHGRPVELRPKEFDLLLALASRPGVVLTRDQILDRVWGDERALDVDSRTVDVHINRLRHRLEGADVSIETVRGIGYRLSPIR